MVPLKEFVREALAQVASGIRSAQKVLAKENTLLNPQPSGELGGLTSSYLVKHHGIAHLVELDLAVTCENGKIRVASSEDSSAAALSRLRFTVGIAFPTAEEQETPETPSLELEL